MNKTDKLNKTLNWLLSISMALLGVSSLIFSVSSLAGLALPDVLVRVLGIVSLVSLPVMVYSTVRKALDAKKTAESAGKKPVPGGQPKKKKKKKKR